MRNGPFFRSILILETYTTSDIADLPTGLEFKHGNTSTVLGTKNLLLPRNRICKSMRTPDQSRYWTLRASKPFEVQRRSEAQAFQKSQEPSSGNAPGKAGNCPRRDRLALCSLEQTGELRASKVNLLVVP